MTQKELREKLGYVPQKGYCSQVTIDSNIRYGKTDISEAEVKEAAEIAQATEFIDTKQEKIRDRSHREEPMYPVVRSRDFRLQEQLPRNRRYLSLMTAFQHWISRQTVHYVKR